MKKIYALLNFIVVLAVIFWNYWSNTGKFNGRSVGDVSNELTNLFTPASYAFSIWGIIFLGLIILSANHLILAFKNRDDNNTILQIGPWLTIANLGNGAWIYFWLTEQIGISVLVMLVILFSLIQVILRTNMQRWNAPIKVVTLVWWPICLYSGWIAVATIANVSAYLASENWSAVFTEVQWTLIMICVATLLNLLLIYTRNMREFAAVGVWSLIAIAVRHWDSIEIIQYTAAIGAAILLIAILIHGYKNRKQNAIYQKVTN